MDINMIFLKKIKYMVHGVLSEHIEQLQVLFVSYHSTISTVNPYVS